MCCWCLYCSEYTFWQSSAKGRVQLAQTALFHWSGATVTSCPPKGAFYTVLARCLTRITNVVDIYVDIVLMLVTSPVPKVANERLEPGCCWRCSPRGQDEVVVERACSILAWWSCPRWPPPRRCRRRTKTSRRPVEERVRKRERDRKSLFVCFVRRERTKEI